MPDQCRRGDDLLGVGLIRLLKDVNDYQLVTAPQMFVAPALGVAARPGRASRRPGDLPLPTEFAPWPSVFPRRGRRGLLRPNIFMSCHFSNRGRPAIYQYSTNRQ